MVKPVYDLQGKRVFVAGHRGMVGSALVRRLADEDCEVLTADRSELDLREQASVRAWLSEARPDVVILAAAKVGGILANDRYPADFLFDNLVIETSVIEAAYRCGTAKLLFLGSSCIYPKHAPQPMTEEALLTGPLEPTNEWYAIAKIAGLKLCAAYRKQYGADFISAMPTNLYGPGDNFNLEQAHVVPALLRKAHDAKLNGERTLMVWGSGAPRREFLHVDDCADALVYLLQHYSDGPHVNIGCGSDVSIRELADLVLKTVGFEGDLTFDTRKPDGTPRKLMDASKLTALGWTPRIDLESGLKDAYAWFLKHQDGALIRV